MARFIRRGTTKIYFLPAIAAWPTGGPTAAEIDAGTNLTGSIADSSGWTLEGSEVDTPDMASTFDKKIPGTDSVGDSSLTFYAEDGSDPVRTALPKATAGFIYIAKAGRVAGRPADVFRVRVRAVGDQYSVGNDAARYVISFSITETPKTDIAVP